MNEEAITRVGQQRRRGKNCYNREQVGSTASSAGSCMYVCLEMYIMLCYTVCVYIYIYCNYSVRSITLHSTPFIYILHF